MYNYRSWLIPVAVVVWLVTLCQSPSDAQDPSDFTTDDPGGFRYRPRHRDHWPGDHRHSPNDVKRSVEAFLHYQGLEEPLEDERGERRPPHYVQAAFEAMDTLDYDIWVAWRQRNQLSDSTDPPTIWGINALQATTTGRHMALSFPVQTEVLRISLSHSELVYPLNILGLQHTLPRRVRHKHLRLCLHDSTTRSHCVRSRQIAYEIVHIDQNFYLVFNITTLFNRWLDTIPQQSHSFTLVVMTPVMNPTLWRKSEASPLDGYGTESGPLLALYSNVPEVVVLKYGIPSASLTYPLANVDLSQTTSSGRGHRLKRSPGFHSLCRSTDEPSNSPQLTSPLPYEVPYCALIEWYADFASLGWDSMIYRPRGFHVNQCRGECSLPYIDPNINYTNHAMMKMVYTSETLFTHHDVDPHSLPSSSCAPIRLKDISVLVRAGPTIFVDRCMQSMWVTHCGCL